MSYNGKLDHTFESSCKLLNTLILQSSTTTTTTYSHDVLQW